jgi:hypothetical protein
MGSSWEIHCCCIRVDRIGYVPVNSTKVPSNPQTFADFSPTKAFPALVNRLLRTTTFLTMAIGTSWSSICLFQYLLPSSFLPQKRFFLSGLLGGSWAFIDRKKGRGRFLYSARLSIESAWNVAVKRGFIKPVKSISSSKHLTIGVVMLCCSHCHWGY